ncbi:glutamate--tRNA ligase [Hirschia baltica]|uniref:Glutamate--tRNA ligase n=1 Tax=Hirschia baltica (strain ATCC 49814 / DSM 5838 / IFAM 1418) TaxID=582402 RepID=C6XJU5_HIRBI|nr:glutamate--tRNA ligase [Hirschia baltica]ACT59390.1 glutamyl-tRNA synthetase [Hirschia baltica ATCC 49814]
MTVITRFAPSPTGYLHIGGARTALFNWLYAKANNGKFLLRIEDTDRERSTQNAVQAIFEGLDWLGITPDEEPTFQFQRADRHREVVEEMISKGTAFKCYTSQEELAERREQGEAKRADAKIAAKEGNEDLASNLRAEADKLLAPYRSPYRDGKTPTDPNASYVVRLRAPDEGRIEFTDDVQGHVGVSAGQIDDLILLRTDGTPTYMIAVVVDDHDMGVTQVIRGDDHLGNTYRQIPIYQAMGWDLPKYAHVPLIHGPDGKKLSKRHGALGVEAYRDMGYLPEGMNNYLLRLGWSHGDDEIIPQDKAIEWFNTAGLGKAPGRLDFEKMKSVNAHYMAQADDNRLCDLLFSRDGFDQLSQVVKSRIKTSMSEIKNRAATIEELEMQTNFLLDLRPIEITGKLKKKMSLDAMERLSKLTIRFKDLSEWNNLALTAAITDFCADEEVGMGMIGPTLRAALTGGSPAPDLGLVLEWLGRDESLSRIDDQLNKVSA